MVTEDRVEKIRKLLAMAERTENEAEAAAFNEKATALMISWGIEEALVQAEGKETKDEIIRVDLETSSPLIYAQELVGLGCKVARTFGMRGFSGKRWDTNRHYLIVVGYSKDIERFTLLWTSLQHQALTGMHAWWKTYMRLHHVPNDKKAKQSFIYGFAARVSARLQAARRDTVQEATQTNPGTDLVLVNREKLVDGWVLENMATKKARARTVYQAGVWAGDSAGRRANLGQTGVGGGHRALPS